MEDIDRDQSAEKQMDTSKCEKSFDNRCAALVSRILEVRN